MTEQRYHVTETGIAIHEGYTITLMPADEALQMMYFLLRNVIELEKLRREQMKGKQHSEK